MSDEFERLDPVGTIAAFGRVAYSDLFTVVWVSLLFWFGSMPLLTIGASLAAATETMRAVVDAELEGRGFSERSRLAHFRRAYRENLRRGVPVSLLILGIAGVTLWYASIGVSQRSGVFIVGALVGLYVFTAAVVLTLHSIDISVSAGVSLREAFEGAFDRATAHLSFTVLEATFAVVLTLICVAFGLTVILVLPGFLALLTVVSGEETDGRGAETVVLAYRGELV